MKFKIVFVILVILLMFSSYQIYAQLNQGKVELKISDDVRKDLNQLYYLTDSNEEFLGNLDILDNEIVGFKLIGYKNLDTNKVRIVEHFSGLNNTIHSHPNGACYLSERDKLINEKVMCVICGIDELRCFEN